MGLLFLHVVVTMARWRSSGVIIRCLDTAWQACRTATTCTLLGPARSRCICAAPAAVLPREYATAPAAQGVF